ncbi:hypothetical protein KX729_02285 [Rhizobium sp. XQZ8]|jgi:hypothetical protein|uniref:DUF6985 domain-containing protein n=1 Tax=Rhizobium populisoli TaxID=2859785 RepID=UPI001CA5AC44|nr:hypothetical protein [Rhizobium populisoli]MBW6420259.1 hypothetical protein [Rhizobium populisoli]
MTETRIPYFDHAEVEVDDIDLEEPAAAALKAFLCLDTSNRLADARHVFAYYADFRALIGEGEWLDDEMGVVSNASEIWRHVTPGPVFVEKGRRDDDNCYVVMEAECAWDREHGLMMVWRGGTTLCKVGGYDGHITNANAYADDTLADVVYRAVHPQHMTRLTDPS